MEQNYSCVLRKLFDPNDDSKNCISIIAENKRLLPLFRKLNESKLATIRYADNGPYAITFSDSFLDYVDDLIIELEFLERIIEKGKTGFSFLLIVPFESPIEVRCAIAYQSEMVGISCNNEEIVIKNQMGLLEIQRKYDKFELLFFNPQGKGKEPKMTVHNRNKIEIGSINGSSVNIAQDRSSISANICNEAYEIVKMFLNNPHVWNGRSIDQFEVDQVLDAIEKKEPSRVSKFIRDYGAAIIAGLGILLKL